MALKHRGWKGDPACSLCGRHETTTHIFFSCSLARFILSRLGNAFGWDKIPSSMGDLQGSRLSQMFGTNMQSWTLFRAELVPFAKAN